MSSLADKVIEANSEEERQSREEEIRLDDIGFPLPIPDTEKAWCEYLTARLIYLNNRMYSYLGFLWLDHVPIKETKESYYRLARYPKGISDPENQYIWRRAKEIVPVLDTSKIAILPDLTFNTQTGEVERETVWTVSPWEGKEME